MTGSTSKRAAVEMALSLIEDPAGQGPAAFTRIYPESARQAADAVDEMVRLGLETPPLAGVVVSVKDLFDVRGEVTLAGSKILATQAPAACDAEVVRRLRQAGAAIIGKTNMTEFAFSGLGLNPHYGTPLNAWDRENQRIPGGSSSGAAVSVTDGMALIAIGTDTGGSCRIPAALNGLVGFKPSAYTVPKDGAFPLSYTYDSVGPIASTTEQCALAYAVLSNTRPRMEDLDAGQLVLGVVKNYVQEGLDDAVAASFDAALSRLADAGATVREINIGALDEIASLTLNGGILGAQAYQIHRRRLQSGAGEFDPRVAARIRMGEAVSCSDYIELQQKRSALADRFDTEIYGYHAIVMPTVPVVAPRISDLSDDQDYVRTNLLMLRNPSIANMMDMCSISLPCHRPGGAPVGLMLTCSNGSDWHLLSTARVVERVLNGENQERGR